MTIEQMSHGSDIEKASIGDSGKTDVKRRPSRRHRAIKDEALAIRRTPASP